MRLLGSDEVLAKLQSGESGRQILEEARARIRTVQENPGKVLDLLMV